MPKRINLFIFWQYDVRSKMFDELLHQLNVDNCSYLYREEEEFIERKGLKPIYLYNGLDYYKKDDLFTYELDDEIIHEMKQFEMPALDIINRWRGSISSKSSYSEIRKIYFIYLRFWFNYIKKNDINLCIITTMPHVPATYFPYAICKCLGIPVILQGIIPFTSGEKINYFLKPDIEYLDCHFNDRLMSNLSKGYTLSDLPSYLSVYFSQYRTRDFRKKRVIFYNQKLTLTQKARNYFDRAKIYFKRSDTKLLAGKIKNLVAIKLSTKALLKKVEEFEVKPDYTAPFYFFPLHLQPEATTLPNGGTFVDQLLAIRMIAQNLPKGTFLYVKEHPSYWLMKNRLESIRESRSVEYYKSIINITGVKLIDHREDSISLMQKCKCVITVTGTAGFEGLFQDKPVMLFGETFYQNHVNVYNIRTNEDCRKAVEYIETNEVKYDQNYMISYLKALEKYVVPMGANEQNFIDNGTPAVSEEDRLSMVNSLTTFYKEYYEKDND